METQLIRWRTGMSVDGGVIDDDHRHLIDIVNSFSVHRAQGPAALPQALKCLDALQFYAQTHFEREERLQRQVAYPERRMHRAEHEELSDTLVAISWRAQRTLTADDASGVVADLATLLRRWLLNHIIVGDLGMKPYAAALKSYGLGLPPLQSIKRDA
jgi:hemerythrin-like metal-binding protein